MSAWSADSGDQSLMALFRLEAEGQIPVLTQGLLALEAGDATQLEALMRAAHSLKGAARIVGVDAAVRVAHAMEDCFVAAQDGEIVLGRPHIDRLLAGLDVLARITRSPDAAPQGERAVEIDAVVAAMEAVRRGEVAIAASGPTGPAAARTAHEPAPAAAEAAQGQRALRVTADNLNRLLALASESLVDSRRWRPFATSLQRVQRLQHELAKTLDGLREQLARLPANERVDDTLAAARRMLALARESLGERVRELDGYDRAATLLAHRLYDAALAVRMRPFADATAGLPRLVRDLARELGKDVRLELRGGDTPVDRDILEKLEAPLGHLVRNAVDHGLELPAARIAAGKAAAGTVIVEARHSAGVLLVSVTDDGRGIAFEQLRAAVAARGLVPAEMAARVNEAELLEFLFLPGFSLAPQVTEISGRGVGLDVVQTTVRQVRGAVRAVSQPGRGMEFHLQLPLTLSVARALLVEIAGEPYAVPLAFITRTLRLRQAEISTVEGREIFSFEGRQTGLVSASQVLGYPGAARGDELAVVVLGEAERVFGVVVDRLLGERELVVQPLDARLGKLKDIAAGAIMEDGSPALIVDVADFLRSVEKLAASGSLAGVRATVSADAPIARKRILVVDDSLTVRELERKLLQARAYDVEIAVDGMDAWHSVRAGRFDLVITDVDMPRLDGIELTRFIKQDARLRGMPVMIVSYKDRPEDRERGMEAGADYYLTKGSFHDETMVNAVHDLIGPAGERAP